ncbi:MFS transporter [Pseudomonas putida]|uniref:MFS transporter n=1 Tax=Pseudomonas putida TaxID=303 RepID=UPI0009BE1564|nr:MFS transporter [Pseudomonas putida]
MMDTVNQPDGVALSAPAVGPDQSLGWRKLLILAAGAFAVGTSEFLMMGTLPAVAADLGVSVAAAGQLVSAFAIGIAVGGPLLAGAVSRYDRRKVLVGALLAFMAANAVGVIAPVYSLAIVMRFVAGAFGGLFYGIAFSTAATTAAPNRQGAAMAIVMGGVTMATVLGTPLGAWIGQHLGWRTPYGLISALTFGVAAAVHLLLPRIPGQANLGSGVKGAIDGIRSLFSVFDNRPLTLLYLAIILVNTGWFALYTYIAPFWTEVSGVSAATVPTALLAYGIFSAIGGAAGGKLANGHATTTMLGSVGAQAILLGAMMFSTTATVSLVIAMLWGFAAWVFVTAVQVRVVALARAQSDVASSVAVSAFNVGNAAGALAGGAVVAHYGLVATPAAAAGFVLAGLAIALFSGRRPAAAERLEQGS